MVKFATPFNLVSKPDRRQNPDRRRTWRGSRRMADLRAFGQLRVPIDGVLEWAPETETFEEDGGDVKVAKYIH